MRTAFLRLRQNQLEMALTPFAHHPLDRPQRGWIRAIRQASGVTIRELAGRLGKSPSLVASLETSEAADRITLHSLRQAAEAMDCRLVYAFVPKSGSFQAASEARANDRIAENVLAIEHSMALEDQAAGNVDDVIAKKIDERRSR